ncbi:MAG: hypothetical protein VYA30_06340 [Myxococcota bacterium]|nr:hypothetical protein [Myxococcota bacterium]
MSKQTHKHQMPPVLHSGGRLDFQGAAHLNAVWERELSRGRLTAINAGSWSVFDRLELALNLNGVTLEISLPAEIVFAQGDVLGLECRLSEELGAQIASHFSATTSSQAESGAGLTVSEATPAAAPEGGQSAENQHVASREVAAGQTREFEQGSIRDLQSIQDALLVRQEKSFFSLLRSLQTTGRYGRLTLLSGGEPWTFVLNPSGGLTSFRGRFRKHLGETGGVSTGQLSQVPELVELEQLMAGLQVNPGRLQIPERRAFNRGVLQCLVDTLLEVCSVKGAQYIFEPGRGTAVPGWGGVPFSVYGRRFLEALSKNSPRGDLDAMYEFRKEAYPNLVLSDSWYPDLLRLNEAERRFVDSSLNKGRNLRQLLTLSPLNRRGTLEFVAILAAMGLLEFSREKVEIDQTKTIISNLNKRVERASQGYFEALDVHASAHWSEYESARERMNARYGDGAPIRGLGHDVVGLCNEIMDRVNEAFAALDTKEGRVAYRRQRYSQTELRGFAQLLLDKLKLAILREDNQQAVRLKAMALELAPRMAMTELRKLLETPEDELTL